MKAEAQGAERAVPEPLQREMRGSVLGVMAAAAAAAAALSFPGVLFSIFDWSSAADDLAGDSWSGQLRLAVEESAAGGSKAGTG
jgi:hypothetical protein